MRGSLAFTAVLATAALMSGCAGEYMAAGGGSDEIDVAPQGYNAWYDGYYGPFMNGYWGADGAFYYRIMGGRYLRDDSDHFRRSPAAGFQAVRGHPRGGSSRQSNDGDITHPKN